MTAVSNRFTNSSNPQHVNSRIFIGNLDCDKITREELENMYSKFGEIIGVSLHKTFAFVQFSNETAAKSAALETTQTIINDKKIDVNVASERRKAQHPSREGGTTERSGESYQSQPRLRGPSRFSDQYNYSSPYGGYERVRPGGNHPPPTAQYYGQGYGSSQYVGYPPVVPQSSQPTSNGPVQSEIWPGYQRPLLGGAVPASTNPGYQPRPTYQQQSIPNGVPDPTGLRAKERDFTSLNTLLPSTARSLVDCEVIATSPSFNNYADYLRQQIVLRGLKCNVNVPSHESLVPVLKNRAMTTGVPFCILIENGSEMHPSITLCLYFSSPEEHRNMTIDAALELLNSYSIRIGINSANPASTSVNNGSGTALGSITFPSAASAINNQNMKYNMPLTGDKRELHASTPYSGGTMLLR